MKTGYFSFLLMFLLSFSVQAFAHPHLLRLADRQVIGFTEMLDDLKSAEVVLIGELHNHAGHHQAQLEVIRALHEAGLDIAVGLEMFRADQQHELNRWNAGELDEESFLPIYKDNWSMWPLYREIFTGARDAGIPLIVLNTSRELTKQVASGGMASLPEGARESLGPIPCVVDPDYMQFIRQAMGGHGGMGTSFLYFCEAQLLWDVVMARNLTDYRREYPGRRMVVLAGSGHSWKYGIPSRLTESGLSYRVILPEMPGRLDRRTARFEDADYLWLNEGEGSWERGY
jgi:uncharacterized iron-regulated protein